MTDYVGLTWDHPRGRHALDAAARRMAGPDTLRWDVQPLEGFESASITDLAQRYDVLVLDHPHLGDALQADCLQPMDSLLPSHTVAQIERGAMGSSVRSYQAASHLWALPLDAATQVSARRSTALGDAPETWEEALTVAESGRLALSLAGPHAYLTFCSIAVSLGSDPADGIGDRATAAHALDLMTALAGNLPVGSHNLNPIGLLDRMQATGDIDYLPLVYGYVTYSSPTLRFGAPPRGTRLGSTLGGTGIAITRRSTPSPALLAHLAWLLDDQTQRNFIPIHDGQPSARAAWSDKQVDDAAYGFYRATYETMDTAWVRPRFAGYVPLQTRASTLVRAAVLTARNHRDTVNNLQQLFADQSEIS